VVQMLREAIKRRQVLDYYTLRKDHVNIFSNKDVEIDVVAVVNDTTGTLMSCAHKNHECRCALIVGTGFNACYMEHMNNVEMLEEEEGDQDQDQPSQMIVNTECGAFGDNGCLEFVRTSWDEQIDLSSLNKGEHIFEKMISGMYMGEMVRLIALDLTCLLFNGQGSDGLFTPFCFTTAYISSIESDSANSSAETLKTLQEMDLAHATQDDIWALKLICRRVSTRAAHLVAAVVATILNKMKRQHTTVAFDGSVCRYDRDYDNTI